jgi:hypothetical protein
MISGHIERVLQTMAWAPTPFRGGDPTSNQGGEMRGMRGFRMNLPESGIDRIKRYL